MIPDINSIHNCTAISKNETMTQNPKTYISRTAFHYILCLLICDFGAIGLLGCASAEKSDATDDPNGLKSIPLSLTTSTPTIQPLGTLDAMLFFTLKGNEQAATPPGNDFRALVDKLIAGDWKYAQGLFWTFQKSKMSGDYYRSLSEDKLRVTRTSDDRLGATGLVSIFGRRLEEDGTVVTETLLINFLGPVRVMRQEDFVKVYGAGYAQSEYHFVASVTGNYMERRVQTSTGAVFETVDLTVGKNLGITPLNMKASSPGFQVTAFTSATESIYLQQP